jgi:polysaccharide pyruvyl transferase WcaK-like protein
MWCRSAILTDSAKNGQMQEWRHESHPFRRTALAAVMKVNVALTPRHAKRRRIAPRRIGLFGGFGWGNSGNEGSLEAMLIFLRRERPDAQLVCICAAPDVVQRDHGIRSIAFHSTGSGRLIRLLDRLLFRTPSRLANWIYAIQWMRKLDLVIIPGTGILDDFGAGPWSLPYTLLRWCLCARLCGAEIWFVSIGAGPIRHPMSRRLMKWAAATAQYRSYRDAISKEFMGSLGLDTRSDPVFPDLAFKLPDPECATLRRPDRAPLTVGVGIMNYGGWRSDLEHRTDILDVYLKKMTEFVIWLLDHGYRARILTGSTFDKRAVDNLMKAVSTERPTIVPESLVAEPTLSLHDLMRQIALTDIVVATRFHNIVCALKLSRPTISVGYAHKTEVLLADMGLGNFCQPIEELNIDLLMRQFTALVAERREHEQRIASIVRAYKRQLASQDAFLSARLLPGPSATSLRGTRSA